MKTNTSTFRITNLLILLSFFVTVLIFSCHNPNSKTSSTIFSDSIQKEAGVLEERIFFLLHQIKKTPSIQQDLKENNALVQFQKNREKVVSQVVKDCADIDCLVKALVITEQENEQLIEQLNKTFTKNKQDFKKFIDKKIRPSHAFILNKSLSDSDYFLTAWQQQKEGFRPLC